MRSTDVITATGQKPALTHAQPNADGIDRRRAAKVVTAGPSRHRATRTANMRGVPSPAPRHTPLELLALVREVAALAAQAGPEKATQAAWDSSRADAGHSDAPRARSICDRLGVSWPRLLRITHGNPDNALRALGNLAADKGRKGHTLPRVAVALRQAALRLGKPGSDAGTTRRRAPRSSGASAACASARPRSARCRS